jgi:hypothetical protein
LQGKKEGRKEGRNTEIKTERNKESARGNRRKENNGRKTDIIEVNERSE